MHMLIIYQILTILQPAHIAGVRPTGFDGFMSRPSVKELLEKYQQKEIETKIQLHQQLIQKGVDISFRTLERYLGQIKKCESRLNGIEENMESIDVRQCYTKFDRKIMYLIGDRENYRKYVKTNEHEGTVYVACLSCRSLHESCDQNSDRIVATAIIREGELDKSHKIIHTPGCSGKGLENYVAEQMDRAQRREIGQCSNDLKSIWREGADNAREHDIDMELEIDDPTGFSFNYPSWSTVRSSYNRRRQHQHGHESADKFFVPDRLQLTKHGAIKLVLEKSLNSHDMWLQFRDKEEGVLLFMTHTQKRAASRCKIMVSDATFHLAPSQFRQLWTIHGLMELENGAEWTPLLFAVMERRTQSAYEILLEQLNEIWGDSIKSSINRVHSDYEMAEINALQKFFGVDKVYGCVVHFIRATIRHIQMNRPTLYREFLRKGEVWKWIRRCISLPFLRKNEIKRMWPVLKTFKNDFAGELREEMNGFVVYFSNQWISKVDKGNLFSFNKLSRTRSTNPVEAWHSVIKRDVASVRHASMANVLNYFQTIFAESDERIVKILNGKIKPRSRDQIYESVDQKIQNLLTEYEEMVDQDQISEDEFGQATQTYLNRLSYLLLQMEGENLSTRKDLKIREKKRKFSSVETDNQNPTAKSNGDKLLDLINQNSASNRKDNGDRLLDMLKASKRNEQPKDNGDRLLDMLKASKRNEQPTNNDDLLLDTFKENSMSSEVSSSRELLSNSETSMSREVTNSQESSSHEIEVQHIKSMGRNPMNLVFNPPDAEFQQKICYDWEYTYVAGHVIRTEQIDFVTTDYGPGIPIRIVGDGNCGYRALSKALTGTENNHIGIRRDIIEQLEETINQHRRGIEGNDWWMIFDTIENIRAHIEQAVNPATDSGDIDKWAVNIDFACASKLFRINIVVCESIGAETYRWQLYSPNLRSSLATIEQRRDLPSVFINLRSNHYELMQTPEKINL